MDLLALQNQDVVKYDDLDMYPKLTNTITNLLTVADMEVCRKSLLQNLIDYIQKKLDSNQPIQLNFICTHNSRRSHLAQIWAQVAASYFEIPKVHCYSGGTEETCLYAKVVDTLNRQGFEIFEIAHQQNPIYAIKYDDQSMPISVFSKKFDHFYNPSSHFAAIMTCSQADIGCPFVTGSDKRIPITYEDPKMADGRSDQDEVYFQRSLEIAKEMFYVFSKINLNRKA